MRIVVTGGRAYNNREHVFQVLDNLLKEFGSFSLVHGGYPTGVDDFAKDWAAVNNIDQKVYPADWKKYGRSAGPIRNREMINSQPDLVVAFPGNNGTWDTIYRAIENGIEVRKHFETLDDWRNH